MDGYSISQVAERTGFPASTLRYYEQSGLVRPGRTAAGYRCYDDTHLERLSFIGRAKGFGLSLDEITELLALLGDDRCAPVQDRLRDLVDAKIADAQARVAELTAFTTELRRVASRLGTHTPDGPCDDDCGCTTDGPAAVGRSVGQAVVLGRAGSAPAAGATAADPGPPPIACTLPTDEVAGRVEAWQAIVTGASHQDLGDGVRLRFARGVDVARLAGLVAAEQRCCRFFTFTLTIGPDEVVLDVTAPVDARPMVDALVGAS